MCKLVLTGFGNMPLLAMTLDGVKDDGILNLSALSRRLGCSRSTLLDRIKNHNLEEAVRHFLNEKRNKSI